MKNLFTRAQHAESSEGPKHSESSEGPPHDEASEEVGAGPDTDNPQYQQAIDLVQRKLYQERGDEAVAKALQSAPDISAGLADQAQTMLALVDDATQGAVPDELVMIFGIEVLGELVEIAQASGMQVGGREIAAAMQQLIVGIVQQAGGDTSQVQQAMAQINPDQIGAALDQVGNDDEQQQPGRAPAAMAEA